MENNRQFLKAEDLELINSALAKGMDVAIQLTKDGYRIVAKKIKVLKQVKAQCTNS